MLLGNYACFFCRLLIFFKINFFKTSFRNTIKVSNSLIQKKIVPDLGPNCLQKLSADDTSRQWVNQSIFQKAKAYKILGPTDEILVLMAMACSKGWAFVQSIQNLHCWQSFLDHMATNLNNAWICKNVRLCCYTTTFDYFSNSVDITCQGQWPRKFFMTSYGSRFVFNSYEQGK